MRIVDIEPIINKFYEAKEAIDYLRGKNNKEYMDGEEHRISVCIYELENTPRFNTGVKDVNGKEICEGDKVKGMHFQDKMVDAVCKYSKKHAAFGLEWQRGNITEFNPFCCLCNIEYEVIE